MTIDEVVINSCADLLAIILSIGCAREKKLESQVEKEVCVATRVKAGLMKEAVTFGEENMRNVWQFEASCITPSMIISSLLVINEIYPA